MNCILLEILVFMWNSIVGSFEIFFRKLYIVLIISFDFFFFLKIMIFILKVFGINNLRVNIYLVL